MLNTFRAYDPATIQSKSYSTACEQCYARKVKCELLEDGKCKQCADHNVDCKARTRKRKAQSLEEGQREYEHHPIGRENANGSRARPDGSDTSSEVSKRRMSSVSSIKPARGLHRSSSVSVPDLFVNRELGTNFSPESSEHIETPAQDRFRNASFLSRSAILGNDFQDIDHAHAERVVGEDKVSPTELKALKLHGAFDLPDLPLRQSLIEAFQDRCWTFMPVIDLWNSSQPRDGSLLLQQAILLAGALMRPDVCSKGFCDCQYERVKALIMSGYERDPLNILAALCLVQWHSPKAPKDISQDVPRVWNTYAVGLAQQMGLHRPLNKQFSNSGLRNRIWWTIVARDNLTSSAHGRPRITQPEDCAVSTPSLQDFENPQDIRADIFIHYVAIIRILGDICQSITRKGEATLDDKHEIAVRLNHFLETLPDHLKLYSPSGLAQQYSLELAQLHVPILNTIAILFRPRTVYQLTAANTASATAAFLNFRIFQAIELREQTRFLSSAFSWHLLVTAIPHLSLTKVSALRAEANEALDAVETVLETLGKVRPSAINNLRNVRAIRKMMGATAPPTEMASGPDPSDQKDGSFRQLGRQLLAAYGQEATLQYEQVADLLRAHCTTQADRSAQAAAHTLSCLSGGQDPAILGNGRLTPDPDPYLPQGMSQEAIQDAFTAVFEDEPLLSTSWMMRDWMDELQF